jgi:putative transposase
MKIFKKIKEIEIYKFGVISPVLHDSVKSQNKYFRELSLNGISIPPGSGNIYYLKPPTFKSWLRKYRNDGLEGLKEKTRKDKGKYQKITDALLESIEKVKEDMGFVSVSDLYRKLIMNKYIKSDDISYETLRKYARENHLMEDKVKKERKKFEKEFINELWMVDFKQGKSIRCGRGKCRTYLCAIIDDASRVLVGYEWGVNEDTTLFARALKKAILTYGIPKILYCDQGKVFLSNYIVQICGRLGISLAHAQPYSPESKAKIERFNGTISQMFYPLIKDFSALTIDELNRKFSEFVNHIYHTKVHTTLGTPPLKKFQELLSEVTIHRIKDKQLEEFFLCSMKRKVRLDATVRINRVDYEAEMKYVGENVDIRFPIDKPDTFYLFENSQMIKQLKPVNLVENANPPHISTSYSKLSRRNKEG